MLLVFNQNATAKLRYFAQIRKYFGKKMNIIGKK